VNIYAFFKKSAWQPWIWNLFIPLGSVHGVFFNKCGKYDLRILLTLMMTNSSGERSFSPCSTAVGHHERW